MTYKDIVERVREVFEYADARNIFEHIAIQINVTGEGEGIMYKTLCRDFDVDLHGSGAAPGNHRAV